MPFGALERPSLSLGLLQAHCQRLDVACETRYLTFDYAERVGRRRLPVALLRRRAVHRFRRRLAVRRGAVRNAAVRRRAHTWTRCSVVSGSSTTATSRDCNGCRAHVDPSLSDCLRSVPWEQYTFVGFTSVFQQNVASLALSSPREGSAPRSDDRVRRRQLGGGDGRRAAGAVPVRRPGVLRRGRPVFPGGARRASSTRTAYRASPASPRASATVCSMLDAGAPRRRSRQRSDPRL